MHYVLIWFIYTGGHTNNGAVEFSSLEKCNYAKEQILSKVTINRGKISNYEMIECFEK